MRLMWLKLSSLELCISHSSQTLASRSYTIQYNVVSLYFGSLGDTKLGDGTVPPCKKLGDGTVPSCKKLGDGTVPSCKKLGDGTVPSFKS